MRQQGCIWGGWLLVVAATAGCGSTEGGPEASQSHRIVGRWHGEMRFQDGELASLLAPEQVDSLRATTMDVDFRADGTLTLSGVNGGAPYQSVGEWQIVSDQGQQLILKSLEGEGNEKQITVHFGSEDTFTMPLPEPLARVGAMEFTRLR